jgi:hypothetical protein
LSCTAQKPELIGTFDFICQKVDPDSNFGGSDSTAPTSTEFPEPGSSAFPSDLILFQDTSGQVTIASARTLFESIDVDITNSFDSFIGPAKFLQRLRWWGRSSASLAIKHLLTASPNDQANYEANTALDSSMGWVNGGQSLTIDFNVQNKIESPLKDDLTNGQTFRTDFTMVNYYDSAASSDLVVTVDDTA